MAEAGPSSLKKLKKKQPKNGVRSSKVRKVQQVRSIEALEEAAMQYVRPLRRSACSSVLID